MKKFVFLVMGLLAVNILPAQNASGKLTVWSFTDELATMINTYFKPTHQDVQVQYSQTPSDQFENRLDPVLASGRGAPDVISLEASFVRKYVESGYLLDITDIYEANKNKMLAYPVEVGTYNGRVYALSWQGCPGAMFYRRSLARKYLGTDDPVTIQENVSSPAKFLRTAKILKQKSSGICVITASYEDLFNPFLGARTQPWVVNSKIVIEPVMEEFMTWIGAWKDTPNPNAAKEFIRYLATDNGFQQNWAQDTGDFVTNTEVVNKIKGSFSEPYLGGQNHYAAFAEIAKNINGKLTSKTNDIDYLFREAVAAYREGEKTKERALADFRRKAAELTAD